MSTIAHFTVAEYDRMISRGAFDPRKQRRLELVRGEIREKAPVSPAHEHVSCLCSEWSVRGVAPDCIRVRVLNSVGASRLDSVLEPDIAWVVSRDYWHARPNTEDVLLIIEVAESSLEYDRGEKAELYAETGIVDYWIVNIPERTVEVRRDPQGGRYRSVKTYRGHEEIRPLAMPELILRPAMLWAS